MSKALISIGLPVYNGQSSIDRAIFSVLSQSFRDFELIISDNDSTDQTREICLEHARVDGRVIYYRQEHNIGATNNFLFVLNKSRCPYFIWLAHDDSWSEQFLEKAHSLLEKDNRYIGVISKVLFSNSQISMATGCIEGNIRTRLEKFLEDPSDNSRFYSLFHKQALLAALENLSFDYYAGDWVVMASIISQGSIAEIPEILFFRANADSDRYVKNINPKSFLIPMFPLSRFTFKILKFREVWGLRNFKKLLYHNLLHHFSLIRLKGWWLFSFYSFCLSLFRFVKLRMGLN